MLKLQIAAFAAGAASFLLLALFEGQEMGMPPGAPVPLPSWSILHGIPLTAGPPHRRTTPHVRHLGDARVPGLPCSWPGLRSLRGNLSSGHPPRPRGSPKVGGRLHRRVT